MDQYKRLNRELSFKGNIIDFYSDTIEINGERKTTFDFIHHNGASAMIPVDKDGKILMVRQYRNAIDSYTLEIPAGGLNKGEDNLTCAIRECEEETGYIAGKAHHLIDIYTTVAFSNEKISIFYTNDLTPSKQNLDEDEYVTIEKHSLDEIIKMIYNGTIQDAKTIAGILAYKTKQTTDK
ncbi:NUDIX hydrolase [Mobilitalea sibirica]|uniref:NUDIX hydrolase n=1 Tax=Mobilitalea sibirica TaxID=1462919 RepID=A0A8J7H451_9FIRM|nr:NUDIX hydrolase [Mobilitalea sibirica]MBH1941474.1 NUDIX hydrolase [Mobilitalea sibirica]